jgi:hypothetical protein
LEKFQRRISFYEVEVEAIHLDINTDGRLPGNPVREFENFRNNSLIQECDENLNSETEQCKAIRLQC